MSILRARYRFYSRLFDFVLLSPRQLLERYDKIGPSSETIQSYFCVTDAGRCWEVRGVGKSQLKAISGGMFTDRARDLSEYLNRWPFQDARKRKAV